jgi:signal transduction histidine kinase
LNAQAAAVGEYGDPARHEIISQFTAGAAHDIRNQAAVIIGYYDVAVRELAPGSPARRAVDRMLAAALKINDECRQLLAFTPLYSPEPRAIDINEMIKNEEQNLVALLTTRLPTARMSPIAYAPGLPDVMVDPALLARALSNLVVNARNAMQRVERAPLLTIQTKESGTGVSIFVVDNGCGMDDETLKLALADGNFTTKQGHCGIGMKVIRDVMKSAGGWVGAETVKGRGTKFELWLPGS